VTIPRSSCDSALILGPGVKTCAWAVASSRSHPGGREDHHLFPITDHASQITGIMTPAMDDVLTGKKPPESLTEADHQVNQLFG
jgi:hypothetical protein